VDALLELVDIYPTLIELCGLPTPPQQLEGTSFVPLLRNTNLPWKKAVFTHRAYNKGIIGTKTKAFNFIDYAGDSIALYDRKIDPFNLTNIASSKPDVVAKMQKIQAGGWQNALP